MFERIFTDVSSEFTMEQREYQQRIIMKTLNGFLGEQNKAVKSILIESATGSGKTTIALSVARLMQEIAGVRIGWVAHRRYLINQAKAENRKQGTNACIQYISMFDKNPPQNLDMLIIDECQHDAAASAAHIHNRIKPKYILGLSAFPFRTDRVKLCFDATISDSSISELIKLGYLSKYNHYTITEKWSPESVFKTYTREKRKWGKSVIFFHTLADCSLFKKMIETTGEECEFITGASDKDKQLKNFKRNPRCNTAVNCLMLTEGFDFPELGTVFVRPSCKGLTIQMGGRVFRKAEGIEIKNIVQCNRTKYPFMKHADPVNQYLWKDNAWNRIVENRNQEIAVGNMIPKLAKIRVVLPKCVRDKMDKKKTEFSFNREDDA